MSSTAPRPKMSAQEYLAWEREQPGKHEFHDGETFAMAGGSPRHSALALAMGAELRAALRERDCRALNSDQRIGLLFRKKYVYPDASVVCGEVVTEEGTRDVVVNPSVVVEVLSASTEGYARGGKWDGYRRLTSVDDYLLVSQRARSIEHFQRMGDGSWRYTVASEGEQLELKAGGRLSVDAVYEGVFELPGDEDGEIAPTAEP